MPLVSSVLTQKLTDLFSGQPAYPASSSAAALRIAAAYASYAAGALAGVTSPLALSLQGAESSLGSSLASAFQSA